MMVGSQEGYFQASLSALASIERSLCAAGKADVKTIMDFGCGYGRVLRALRQRWPEARITAADLSAEAVSFCATEFDAEPFQSTENLSEARLDRQFDLIWVGSVFTHLPASGWRQLLRYLADHLAPAGVLVFTSHGRATLSMFGKRGLERSPLTQDQFSQLKIDFGSMGFGFVAYGDHIMKHFIEKQDTAVSRDNYGLSFSRTDWVCRLIAEFPQLRLQAYMEAGWGGNHDVVAVCKSAVSL